MDSLWDTSCITASTDDIKHMTGLGLESNVHTTATEKIFYYHRGIKNLKAGTPVLVLLHGYPQTSFMWRHILPLLPKDIPVFIPDVRLSPQDNPNSLLITKLPGYGRSSPLSTPHTKGNVGNAILSTLHSLLPKSSTPHPIILAGHDRGARICQRLTVNAATDPRFSLKGTIILDITPGNVQWQKMATPQAAAGMYHWAFLPNIELATAMILAFGGDKYVRTNLERWSGKNEAGIKKLKEHDAEKVYGDAFMYETVIRASCDDYRASAFEEIQEHEDDQREGRKMDADVLVLYSSAFQATRGRIEDWQDWMGKGKLETKGFGDGVGHFIAEEAPEQTAKAIVAFYNSHV